ncbi:hypothetical protein SEVIR_1G344901v4 [Setaria viridis]
METETKSPPRIAISSTWIGRIKPTLHLTRNPHHAQRFQHKKNSLIHYHIKALEQSPSSKLHQPHRNWEQEHINQAEAETSDHTGPKLTQKQPNRTETSREKQPAKASIERIPVGRLTVISSSCSSIHAALPRSSEPWGRSDRAPGPDCSLRFASAGGGARFRRDLENRGGKGSGGAGRPRLASGGGAEVVVSKR